MITQEVISRVRNGVCAVGYLTVPLTEYSQNPRSPFFQVMGTGFLVHPTIVITNRHVIEALVESQANLGFPSSQFFLSFVVPDERSELRNTVRMIRHFATLEDTAPDIGFVKFKVVHDQDFRDIEPLRIADSDRLRVTEEIAVCGYPYGTAMLKRGTKIYRWGPVIQQGSISALSPFDTSRSPDEILLDVRTAGGMSGAPIFRPSNGEVVGIHYAGWEATTALGLPLTQTQVDGWIEQYNEHLKISGYAEDSA
jgi:S1-C subfamily serine protease